MRVLVLGATGFIGRHVTAALLAAGHDVVAGGRRAEEARRRFPAIGTLACDLARDTDPAVWVPRLAGIDAVVNAAGLLRGPDIAAVHAAGPAALFAACAAAGVTRVIHISAISADDAAGTDYAATKLRGEAALRAQTSLDWVILRPSLVWHAGSYGGTSLLRGLAGLPGILLLPGAGDAAFQPIHADDLARCVGDLLADHRLRQVTLEPAGPEVLCLRTILLRLRDWLDLPPPRLIVAVPLPLVALLARLGDVFGRGPVSSNALRQMRHGNTGDAAGFARAIGWVPQTMAQALARQPSHVQDRWQARLYWLRPAVRFVLALLWLASGLVGLLPQSTAAALTVLTGPVLAGLGLPASLALPLAAGFSVLDIALGLGLLLRRPGIGWLTLAQLGVVLGYTLVLTAAQPGLWLEAYGPLLKNLPILVLVCVHWALDDDR
ncbi:SDR family oxidoreductase [Ferrovibrio xuzhouensis]|uniref:SDR family oxidoreductase n=1 Tax=Ferrovibrio xuzhouensis TaxID=1576914 RepID=A0ABV7VDL1_9PROT